MRFLFKAVFLLALSVVIFGSAAYFAYHGFVKPEVALKHEEHAAPTPPPPDPTIPFFQKAEQLKTEGKLVAARDAFYAFINDYSYSSKLEQAKKELGDLNVAIFFSPIPSPEKQKYVVKRGDSLYRLQRTLKVPMALIMRMNQIDDPRRLHIGQTLLVAHPKFSLIIISKNKTVTLLNHEKFFKQYTVKSWSAPIHKNAKPKTGKVHGTVAWKDGNHIPFGKKGYAQSARWISTTLRDYTFFTEPGEGFESGLPPPTGIGLSQQDMVELSVLLRRGDPVTVK